MNPIEVMGGGMAFTLISRELLDAVKKRNPAGEFEVLATTRITEHQNAVYIIFLTKRAVVLE